MMASVLVQSIEGLMEKYGDFDISVTDHAVLKLVSFHDLLPYQFNGGRRKRFEERDCGYETKCWYWLLTTLHGRPCFNSVEVGRRPNAYRWFYEQIIGEIPGGWVLHHLCKNPMCVNPSHLEPKDRGQHQSEHAKGRKLNLSDEQRLQRSLSRRGTACPTSKLTDEIVISIRRESAGGATYQDLADKYACTKSNIAMIVKRRSWAHI